MIEENIGEPVVYLVDDDEDVRFGLRMLLESAGLRVIDFPSASAFLAFEREVAAACLILDIHMPSVNGLELQQELAANDVDIPIIFLTGHGSVPNAVEALKQGAVDFFEKPIEDAQKLLDCAMRALHQNAISLQTAAVRRAAQARLETLTPRELEVMDRVCNGDANKVIAIDLGISERTVELHRGHAMKKLQVRTVPELIRLRDSSVQVP